MKLTDVILLPFGGLAMALSIGMAFVGRNAIRRIRGLGREDPPALRRLAAIRFFTASIVLLGLYISLTFLLLQIDEWIGLFGPADDIIGGSTFVACVIWFLNAWALDRVARPWRYERELCDTH